jgi:hypothetical protein
VMRGWGGKREVGGCSGAWLVKGCRDPKCNNQFLVSIWGSFVNRKSYDI